MNCFIVVSGIPASGKSTLAASVAAQLKLPLLDKDTILESLFETLGVGDSSWRTRLSRSADGIMQRLATQSQGAVLVSWWRHRLSSSMSGTSPDWLLSLDGELVELHCKCDPHIAVRRFFSRRRHPGHLDNLKSEAEELARFKQSHDHGALGIGRVVEVDTERPPDIHRVLLQLSASGASPSPSSDLGGSMKRVTGIGGIFFKAKDAPALQAWYKRHLGIDVQDWGGTAFTWTDGEGKPVAGTTVWSIGPAQSDQFAPSTATFMVNYRVEDLHALVKVLREEGCNVLEKIDDSEYGKFAWVIDPEGNKVELWQPPAGQ